MQISFEVSKAIIDKHGGTMGVISSGISGEGSVFYVELAVSGRSESATSESSGPASEVAESSSTDDAQHSEAKPLVAGPSSSIEFARALVVDDSALNRRMVRRIISYEVKYIDEVFIVQNL